MARSSAMRVAAAVACCNAAHAAFLASTRGQVAPLSTGAHAVYQFDYSHQGQDWIQGVCASRSRQSPVDLPQTALEQQSSGHLSFRYEALASSVEVVNTGHSIAVDLQGLGVGGVTVGDAWFSLLNVNFHAPSEHTYDGRHYPLEAQMVHKRTDGDALLIVAIPFAMNDTTTPDMTDGGNLMLDRMLSKPLPIANQKQVANITPYSPLDLNQWLAGGSFVNYAGSLTAPPCSERASWMVRTSPLAVSSAQLAGLQPKLQAAGGGGNFRSAMPLNGRTLQLLQAVMEEPVPQVAVASAQLVGEQGVTSREFVAQKWAKDAMRITGATVAYVRDLDDRLRRAATAHAEALATPVAPMPAPAPAPVVQVRPTDAQAAEAFAAEVASQVATATHDALQKAVAAVRAPAN